MEKDIVLGRRNARATSVIFGDSGVPPPEKTPNKTKEEKEGNKYE